MISVAFLITQRLYKGVCSEPNILLAWFVLRENRVLCLVVSKLNSDEILNVTMDSMI